MPSKEMKKIGIMIAGRRKLSEARWNNERRMRAKCLIEGLYCKNSIVENEREDLAEAIAIEFKEIINEQWKVIEEVTAKWKEYVQELEDIIRKRDEDAK